MPWCPKCKNEYINGMTTCKDCNVALVDILSTDAERLLLALIDTETKAEKLIEYLDYSGIHGTYQFSELEQCYEVFVIEQELKKAKKCYQAFLTVEKENTISSKQTEISISPESSDLANVEEEPASESTLIESALKGSSTSYVKKADQYKDLKSTAATFLVFSLLGLVFLVLNIVGVFTWLNSLLQFIVMGIVFVFFFAVGVNSVQRAKKAASESIIEEELTKRINLFLNSQITPEFVSQLQNNELSTEINFILIMNKIKVLVKDQFGEQNDSYLDVIIEDFYNEQIETGSAD